MKNIVFSLCAIFVCSGSAFAQMSLDWEYRLNGRKTLGVFEPSREVLQNHTAVIYRGYKRMVYGIIVSENGHILTKASELEEPEIAVPAPGQPADPEKLKIEPLSVRIGENQFFEEVEILNVDTVWDIALIKIKAKGLKPIKFAKSSKVEQGTWVMTNGATSRSRRRVRVGIVSAKPREIPGPAPVVLGVVLEEKENKIHIKDVGSDSAAEDGGLKKGDFIISADGKEIAKRKELIDLLMEKQPGEEIKIGFLRGDEKQEAIIKLMARPTANRPERMNKNDSMSGRFSRRRDGFQRVLQVDIPMQEHSCGGPLINMQGECLGLVIARANRAETFVVPLEELQEVYQKLLQE